MRRKAFTLIELMVVVAIITILSVLAVLAMSRLRILARDASSRGSVTTSSKAVETFRQNTLAGEKVITVTDLVIGPGFTGSTTLTDREVTGSASPYYGFTEIFTGTENVAQSTPTYGVSIDHSPSIRHSITYSTYTNNTEATFATPDSDCYFLGTTITASPSFFYVLNGTSVDDANALPDWSANPGDLCPTAN